MGTLRANNLRIKTKTSVWPVIFRCPNSVLDRAEAVFNLLDNLIYIYVLGNVS